MKISSPNASKRSANRSLQSAQKALRELRVPVIGRINDGRLILDLRCLDDESELIDQLHNA